MAHLTVSFSVDVDRMIQLISLDHICCEQRSRLVHHQSAAHRVLCSAFGPGLEYPNNNPIEERRRMIDLTFAPSDSRLPTFRLCLVVIGLTSFLPYYVLQCVCTAPTKTEETERRIFPSSRTHQRSSSLSMAVGTTRLCYLTLNMHEH